jgi:hypothetical protein
MRILKILSSLAAVALLALVALPAAAQNSDQPVITLERTACFGSCPIYSVAIYADGRVVYNGERFVTATGEQTTSIDPETVQQLVAGFEAAGYFDWNDEYTDMHITDLPSVVTSVMRDGEVKQITRYAGDSSAPLALSYLENWIDLAAYTSQWTGSDVSATSGVMVGGQPVVITLERTACFGMCPVYGVSIYEDGTVVYLGIKNVAVTGVRVSQVDPNTVINMLTSIMKGTGYFDWQDEYTDITITDQATVITSLSTSEQGKRIVRYGGDANAPIGLTWIEDQIDRSVNSAQWISPEGA